MTVVLTAVALCSAPAVVAQEQSENVWQLGLDNALKIGLRNNLDLVSARYVPEIAEQDIVFQQSNFDAGFEASYDHSEQEAAATQLSTITGSKRDAYNAGLAQNLTFGADYTVGFQINRNEQTGPNVVAPVSYFSGFSFVFNLPLLQGFGTEVTIEQLVLARNNYEISRSDLKGQAQSVIEAVEGAYWDVAAARRALEVARRKLERAQDLLELNRKKVEVGTLAPIEITQAEAGVASDEEGVIVAEITLEDAQDELRRLLAIPEFDPRWDMEIIGTDLPEFQERHVDLEAAIQTGLAQRPEMFGAQQTLRDRELNERVAKRNVRHQLDFRASYIPNGSSLDLPPLFDPITGAPVPGTPNRHDLGDSVSAIFDQEEYQWSANLTYRVPFGNRAAKTNYARARLSRQQADVDLQNQEQTIRVEVRRSARAVESGIKRVEATNANVVLQRKKLEAEQKKFENGMSTSFEVLTFQNDLAESELGQIRAILDYARALTALERSKGTLLEARGLSLE